MSESSVTARKRIEAQGFSGIENKTLAQLNCRLRFAPAIRLAWTAFRIVQASEFVPSKVEGK